MQRASVVKSDTTSSDAVIGLYCDLPASGGLEAFLVGLRRVNREAAVFVMAEEGRVGQGVSEACSRFGATLHVYKVADYPPRAQRAAAAGYARLAKGWALKFDVARAIVRLRPMDGRSLLVDLSDSLVQADPFSVAIGPGGLYGATEATRYANPDNPDSVGNENLLRRAGVTNVSAFAGRHVLCAGTILGRNAPLLTYLDWLLRDETAWDDQGKWNLYSLTHAGLIRAPPVTRGAFLTLARIEIDGTFDVDEQGRILNCLGVPFALVHQTTRCRGLSCDRVRGMKLQRHKRLSGSNRFAEPTERCAASSHARRRPASPDAHPQPLSSAPARLPERVRPDARHSGTRRSHADTARAGSARAVKPAEHARQATQATELLPAVWEWPPPSGAPPRGCVVTVATAELLLQEDSHGWRLVEVTANWAAAHGYRFVLHTTLLGVSQRTRPEWAKPLAVARLLARGERECPLVLHVDADATVHDPHLSLEALSSSLLRPPAAGESARPPAPIVFGCHSPIAAPGKADCHGCRCGRSSATCSAADWREDAYRRHICTPNTGVYLVRNGPAARRLLHWWTSGGNGTQACSHRVDQKKTPEQRCAHQMKQAFPAEVDVVGAHLLNAPAWSAGPAVDSSAAGTTFDAIDERRGGITSEQTRCFRTRSPPLPICHLWGRSSAVRLAAARAERSAQEEPLRALLAARGERYRSFSPNTSWPKHEPHVA